MAENDRASSTHRTFGETHAAPLWRAPGAQICGDVQFGEGASVWFNAVLRAEVNQVRIGDFTNIQDNCSVHIGYENDVEVGAYCSLAHNCVVHGAFLGDCVLIGVGATVMDGASIASGSLVAPGAVVRPGFRIESPSLLAGVPAKLVREHDFTLDNKLNALKYWANAKAYLEGNERVWADEEFDAWIRSKEAELSELRDAASGPAD